MSTKEHKLNTSQRFNVGIITVSTTRTMETDKSGAWISKLIKKEGHYLQAYVVIPDDSETIINTVKSFVHEQKVQVIIITGGTGISPDDVTIETVCPLFEKELTSFGSIFAMLSFKQIDSAVILSRSTAGVIDKSILFCIPGSLNAVKLACIEIIFPELGHIMKHIFQNQG